MSQSEVARRTGVPLSSVNRYCQGARVPAEFCAALVRELGVNPSWLLVGEGAPMLADVPQRTAEVGRNMLELVDAMNAVTRMRLGSLAGKHHLRILRELNEAIRRHDQLRAALDEKIAPVADDLLGSLRRALDARQLDRAQDLYAAAQQVMHLCQDPALKARFDRESAHFAYVTGRRALAVSIQRRNVTAAMADAAVPPEQFLRDVFNLVAALDGDNLKREAIGIAQAGLAIAQSRGAQPGIWHLLRGLLGLIHLECGELEAGLPLTSALYAHADAGPTAPGIVEMIRASFALAMGTEPPLELLARKALSPTIAVLLADTCLLRAQPDELRALKARVVQINPSFPQTNPVQHAQIDNLLAAHARRSPPRTEALEQAIAQGTPPRAFVAAGYLAQAWRIAGKRNRALSALARAQACLRQIDPAATAPFGAMAVHHRNLAMLQGNESSAQWIAGMVAKGYVILREMA